MRLRLQVALLVAALLRQLKAKAKLFSLKSVAQIKINLWKKSNIDTTILSLSPPHHHGRLTEKKNMNMNAYNHINLNNNNNNNVDFDDCHNINAPHTNTKPGRQINIKLGHLCGPHTALFAALQQEVVAAQWRRQERGGRAANRWPLGNKASTSQ